MSGNMHVNNAFPFRISQSQPKEGVKTYYQNNFPQGNLSLNASIHNPKLQTLTPPWRMHVPTDSCPYYNSDEYQKSRGQVETGYKLDYGRTNHEINTRLHKDKNMHTRIRQLIGNDYVDITDPNDGMIDIKDNAFHVPEKFNTPRPANTTYGSLNNTVFYSPNGRSINDYDKPISQEEGYYSTELSSKSFIDRHDLHNYTDEVTIHDNDGDYTEFSNTSYKEAMCPLRTAIDEGMKRKTPWKDRHKDEESKPANPEAFRRAFREKFDGGHIIEKCSCKRRRKDDSDEEEVREGFYIGKERLYKEKHVSFDPNVKIVQPRAKEGFTCQCQPYLDDMYTHILESRAAAIVTYLTKDPSFRPWMREWNFLQANIKKCNMDFKQLADGHEDVAYSLDKGKELSFRFRDKDKYMPLSVESYILAHEMAHVANEEIGHGEKFQELMHLIEVAAYMLQFIDLSKYDDRVVRSNGQEILSRKSIKYELIDGINNLIRHSNSQEQKEYWERIKNRVEHNK